MINYIEECSVYETTMLTDITAVYHVYMTQAVTNMSLEARSLKTLYTPV